MRGACGRCPPGECVAYAVSTPIVHPTYSHCCSQPFSTLGCYCGHSDVDHIVAQAPIILPPRGGCLATACMGFQAVSRASYLSFIYSENVVRPMLRRAIRDVLNVSVRDADALSSRMRVLQSLMPFANTHRQREPDLSAQCTTLSIHRTSACHWYLLVPFQLRCGAKLCLLA
jgi:hypothetical protein